MLTPQEVSEKVFPKSSGFGNGYAMAQVDEFLDTLTEDYTCLLYTSFKEKAAAPAEEKKPLGSFLPKSAAPATKNVIRDSVPAMAQRPHSAETVYVRDVAEPEKPIVTSSPLTGRTYETVSYTHLRQGPGHRV